MHIDKTKNHFHIDIKYVAQAPVGVPGQFVYIASTGDYDLAISLESKDPPSVLRSNVQGVIWSNVGSKGFFIKTAFGPLKYREPFGPDFFNKTEDGLVIENEPNLDLLPGTLGVKLWLSSTVQGGVQLEESNILLGYKTEYGMLYRPEFIQCLRPIF